jgi:hypothetical protein
MAGMDYSLILLDCMIIQKKHARQFHIKKKRETTEWRSRERLEAPMLGASAQATGKIFRVDDRLSHPLRELGIPQKAGATPRQINYVTMPKEGIEPSWAKPTRV